MNRPALLVSFFYLKNFIKNRKVLKFRNWSLDSGAFSAHSSGVKIDLIEYMETIKELQKTDEKLTEVFSLDVIGNWRAGMKNLERMWSEGIKAIPCYHIGEPESLLMSLAKDYDKIALGGVAMLKGSGKLNFARHCFNKVWPKRIHGFGFGGMKEMIDLPFDSVDASTWNIAPCKFGEWKSYATQNKSRAKMPLRLQDNLKSEVKWYLNTEQLIRAKFGKLLKREFGTEFQLRLSTDGSLTETFST